jgi:poly [ADP-ribose] polymerase
VSTKNSAEVDNKYKALRCQVSYVEPDDGTFRTIKDHVLENQVKSRDIEVLNVYGIKREAETSRFTSHLHNQKLLFHGSKISNWVGLLSRGMLMPKSVTALGGKRTGIFIYCYLFYFLN